MPKTSVAELVPQQTASAIFDHEDPAAVEINPETLTTAGQSNQSDTAGTKLEPLTQEQSARRQELEGRVNGWLPGAFQVGEALKSIRDERLYRNTHRGFEAYCQDTFGFGSAHAYRYIVAHEVQAHIGSVPGLSKLTNEAQARPLANLKKADRIRAMKKAVKLAKGKTLTAQLIAQAAAIIQGKEVSQNRKANLTPAAEILNWVTTLKGFLPKRSKPALKLFKRIERALSAYKSA